MPLYYRIIAGISFLIALCCVSGALYFIFIVFGAIYAVFFTKDSNGVGILIVFSGIIASMFASVGIPLFYLTTRAFYFDFKKDARAEELFKKGHKWFLLPLVLGIAYVSYTVVSYFLSV